MFQRNNSAQDQTGNTFILLVPSQFGSNSEEGSSLVHLVWIYTHFHSLVCTMKPYFMLKTMEGQVAKCQHKLLMFFDLVY
jgi:hypothetical protein